MKAKVLLYLVFQMPNVKTIFFIGLYQGRQDEMRIFFEEKYREVEKDRIISLCYRVSMNLINSINISLDFLILEAVFIYIPHELSASHKNCNGLICNL